MRRVTFAIVLLTLASTHVWSPALRAQVESEDLAPPTGGAGAASAAAAAAGDAAGLLAEAESLFASPQQPDALPVLGELVERLELNLADSSAIATLVRALSLRAQIHFNLGDNQAASADLERLIVLKPGFAFDANAASPKLVQLAGEVAGRRVGTLVPTVDPPDAALEIAGVRYPAASPIPLLAGPVSVLVSRPGFAPTSFDLAIEPGSTTPLTAVLPRVKAVLWIRTQPAGVAVSIDGHQVGSTVAAAAARPTEVSEALAVEVEVGTRIIEAALPDHRGTRLSVKVPDLGDYRLEPFLLERAEAEIQLTGSFAGAKILVDGRPAEAPAGRLRVAPGQRRIAVDGGLRGQFEAIVDAQDRQRLDIPVVLRPALTLAGLLGGDRVAAERAAGELRSALGGQSSWSLLDRSADGTRVLGRLGVDASVLRSEATSRRLDWAAIQKGLDALSPATLHVIGALSDDLVATSVELVFLPAAPATPTPERRQLTIGDLAARSAIVASLDQPIAFVAPELGADLIDGLDGATIVNVRPGTPSEAAGLRAGEAITHVAGVAVADRASVLAQLATANLGSPVRLTVRSESGASRQVDVSPALSPRSARPDQEGLLYSALAALVTSARANAATDGQRVPGWVLDLNEAMVLLHAREFDAAVRRLRGIEAPSGPGLGREAADYWLGVALAAASPEYQNAAREAFERAARRPDATFDSADGPFVAPAARARAAMLGGTP